MKKPMDQDQDVTFSELLGSSWAIAQHGIDLAVTGLFRRLKQNAEPSKNAKKKTGWVQYGIDFTRGFVGFIGQTGDAYMKTYEELKRKK